MIILIPVTLCYSVLVTWGFDGGLIAVCAQLGNRMEESILKYYMLLASVAMRHPVHFQRAGTSKELCELVARIL